METRDEQYWSLKGLVVLGRILILLAHLPSDAREICLKRAAVLLRLGNGFPCESANLPGFDDV